ncbi:MAG: ribonuclease J, partial [Piscirickettsiaceae bacterium]|nr:ribonuclease J [Piscirickettsiaceae bacterium]
MTPDSEDFWFLPLGGTGEIGMNMNLYGHDGQWLMVDCGVIFDKNTDVDGEEITATRPHIQMADPQFIADQRTSLVGLIITHAHEDHIGAVPYLWQQLRCPIYTTQFTAEILRRKLVEVGLDKKIPVIVVEEGAQLSIGVFDVEWVALTHSIPEPYALIINTPVGRVFHTADWKLDSAPVVGKKFDEQRYREISNQDIDVMVCDSTNANVQGHSNTEASLYQGLKKHIEATTGRVVVACFGSNIARLHTIAKIAQETNRHLGLLGRSLINMVSAARATGVWQYGNT